jgi:hypothetical protein
LCFHPDSETSPPSRRAPLYQTWLLLLEVLYFASLEGQQRTFELAVTAAPTPRHRRSGIGIRPLAPQRSRIRPIRPPRTLPRGPGFRRNCPVTSLCAGIRFWPRPTAADPPIWRRRPSTYSVVGVQIGPHLGLGLSVRDLSFGESWVESSRAWRSIIPITGEETVASTLYFPITKGQPAPISCTATG